MAFRVGVTRDIRAPDGSFAIQPINLERLEAEPDIEWEFLAEDEPELGPELIDDYDAIFHFSRQVTARSLEKADRLALIARHGVGLDFIDVDACTERGIAITITPDGPPRPMASAALALMLALSHGLVPRHLAVTERRWAEGRFDIIGVGLTDRTLGLIGFGRIGREVAQLVKPYGMRTLVSTPRLAADDAEAAGVEHVELDELLAESDFVVVACPLKPETHHLLDASRLGSMKQGAFLINVARGPIVDQRALVDALKSGQIAGAGLDVFEQEPIAPDDPLLELGNVVVAPHSLGYTDDLFRRCVESTCAAILDVAAGRVPEHLVNSAVLDHPDFQAKIHRRAIARG